MHTSPHLTSTVSRDSTLQPESPLAEAVLRTLLYADVFDFPMTLTEIHHFLIGQTATPQEIDTVLHESRWLTTHITCTNDYYSLINRDLAQLRRDREAASARLMPLARRWGAILAYLPFVHMVALTGALAVRNASDTHDDLDYLLVTAPRRVWTGRAFAVMLVRIARLFGVGLCPNYVLAETALYQDRQDIFTAHEIAQMIPLAGLAVYAQMRSVNAWANDILPNTHDPLYVETEYIPHGIALVIKEFGERLLSGKLGDWFEAWEQRRKLAKFARLAQQPNSSAQLDSDHVKGHFNDYGAPALKAYQERLAQFFSETT
jgi:hypothetical protein